MRLVTDLNAPGTAVILRVHYNCMIKSLIDLFEFYPLDFYAYFLLLLPVVIAIYRREFVTQPLAIVALYFSVRFLEECIFLYYTLIPKSTHNLSSGALVVDILLIGELYLLSFTGSRLARRITIVITAIAFITVSANYAIDGLMSVSHASVRLMMIVLALLYFNKILAENRVKSILLHSMFWVSAGFLFYGMGTFMTSLFKDYLLDPKVTSKETYDLFSDIGQSLSMLHCVLAAVGLWVSKFDKDNYIHLI